MAIGPNQLNETFMAEVDSFEVRIDRELSVSKVAPNSSVNIDVPSGMSFSTFSDPERKIPEGRVGRGKMEFRSARRRMANLRY
jgi:hypothetical protein